MKTIHVHPPEGAPVEQVVLRESDAVVVGREPDPAQAGAAAPPARCLTVHSPLVSGSHVLIWSSESGLHARDLHSKNGTYLRVEKGADVSLHGSDEAHLFLAPPRPAARASGPADIALVDAAAGTFAERMKAALADWAALQGLPVEVRVVRADLPRELEPPFADGSFALPLDEGLRLEIGDRESGRTEIDWDVVKSQLFSWAHEQVARFRTCRAAIVSRPLAFSSPGAQRVLRQVLEAARTDLPLVLRGETGTGKTELAAIYAEAELPPSTRGGRPFLTVHCAHLDPPLAHSVLFGAVKGSYTSSDRTLIGAVKLADGGVLFLDDVDLLPLETQAKLLRFLDQGQYEPLGHSQSEPLFASVRVVAGTNVDLRAAVRERRFREDLYWRLHTGAVVRVPPLRERPEDVEHLLRRSPGSPGNPDAARTNEQRAEGPSVRDRLDASAVDYLMRRHPWRGNFRECLRFCLRVRMEPAVRPLLDRARCEAILAEASLDEDATPSAADEVSPSAAAPEGDAPFERALRQALVLWTEAEGGPPERFDQLSRFCESYLKSAFVAHALGLADAEQRPDSFDRERRLRLGCDLTTLKRKVDDYLALKQAGQPLGAAR